MFGRQYPSRKEVQIDSEICLWRGRSRSEDKFCQEASKAFRGVSTMQSRLAEFRITGFRNNFLQQLAVRRNALPPPTLHKSTPVMMGCQYVLSEPQTRNFLLKARQVDFYPSHGNPTPLTEPQTRPKTGKAHVCFPFESQV